MALEQEEPKQESSSTLSKVVWGALIAGAAAGAVALSPHILAGVGSVAQSAADYFTTPGGTSVGSSAYTSTGAALNSTGAALNSFADGAKELGKDVSTTLNNVFSNAPAATPTAAEVVSKAAGGGAATQATLDVAKQAAGAVAGTDTGIVNTAKDVVGKVSDKVSTGFSALVDKPAATATIAGSALAGAGVGLGLRLPHQDARHRRGQDAPPGAGAYSGGSRSRCARPPG